jgi:1-acyl-sn-glycerol-3-phosphate acyltransferase
VFHLLGQVRLTGLENIPKAGAYIVAANHISIFDPPLALAFWPEMLEAIGAVEVFSRPFQNRLVRMYGTIPVHRGEVDRELLRAVLSLLQSGHRLLIAPEGGRSHVTAMRRAKPGIAYIVEAAQVPVVPLGIVGTTDDFLASALRFRRPGLELRIGKPILLPSITGTGAERHAARQRNADRVMQQIAALLPPEYHGVYADPAIISTGSANLN